MAFLMPEDAKNLLNDVQGEKQFFLHMGANITNLEELSEALGIMSDDTFKHHVNKQKNDFANWVENTVGDEELAKSMKKTGSRKGLYRKINKRVQLLRRRARQSEARAYLENSLHDFALGALIGILIGVVIMYVV